MLVGRGFSEGMWIRQIMLLMEFIPLFSGFDTSQVVQDFLHQQYFRIMIRINLDEVKQTMPPYAVVIGMVYAQKWC